MGMGNLNGGPDAETDIECGDILYPAAIPFVLVHLACFAAIWTGVTWGSLGICAVLYWARIFGIGAGYHRYFSHRAYSTSRAFQLVCDCNGQVLMPRDPPIRAFRFIKE